MPGGTWLRCITEFFRALAVIGADAQPGHAPPRMAAPPVEFFRALAVIGAILDLLAAPHGCAAGLSFLCTGSHPTRKPPQLRTVPGSMRATASYSTSLPPRVAAWFSLNS